MILSREARGGEKAPVSLLDALGVQLCGVNSHKTSLCSQKMRAGRVWPCTYTWSGGNNTFIPYDAFCSHRPPPIASRPHLMFPATNRPRGFLLENTARLHADAKKTSCQSSAKVQTCMCRYTNGNLNVRFPSLVECTVWHLHQRNVRCVAKKWKKQNKKNTKTKQQSSLLRSI